MSHTCTEREERVARAISLAKGNMPDQTSDITSLQGVGGPKWRDYLQEAQVFIGALTLQQRTSRSRADCFSSLLG